MNSSVIDFLAGCTGGIAQVMVGQPFDIIKVRMQAAAQDLYKNTWDCFRKIVALEGGLPALWKGTLPPLLGVGAAVSLQFGVNEKTKQLAQTFTGQSELNITCLFLCGAIAGMANSLISIPVEHTRIRMQIQGGSNLSTIQCVKNISQSYGIGGLYKGAIPTLWRESIALGIYFSMYEWITRQMRLPGQSRSDLGLANILMAGGIAGIALWFTTFPIDVIKTKIQTDSFHSPKYKGMRDCFSSTLKMSGLKGLYKGLTPCLLRAVPANGVTFLAYEAASKNLRARSDTFSKYFF